MADPTEKTQTASEPSQAPREAQRPEPGQLRDDATFASPAQRDAVYEAATAARQAREAELAGDQQLADSRSSDAAALAESAPVSSKDANPFDRQSEPALAKQFDKGVAFQESRLNDPQAGPSPKQNIDSLRSSLRQVDLTDTKRVDEIAKQTLGSLSVKSEEFKAEYDALKPKDAAPWNTQRSYEALNAANADLVKAEGARIGDPDNPNNKLSTALRNESARVSLARNNDPDLQRANSESSNDRGKVVAGTAAAAATIAATTLEQDATSPEAQVAGAALRTAATAAAASAQREPTEAEVTVQGSQASEDAIRNVGTLADERIQARPAELEQKFMIKTVRGTDRYLNRQSEQEAFRDTGQKIIVKPDARKLVAEDVAKLADAKGWDKVAVTGNQTFRREVWKEASVRGIEVEGYKPTEQDKRDLDERLKSVEAKPRDTQSTKENRDIAPKVAAGAIGETKSVNPEVDNNTQRREQLGNAYQNEPRDAAIERYPELKGLYKLESAASQFAQETINDPKDQQRFVSSVRDRGLDELARGNKLPELKVAPVQPQLEKGLAGLGR